MKQICEGFTPPFVEFIESQAYERGHSAGNEEILNIARGLAYYLKDAIIKHDKLRNTNYD